MKKIIFIALLCWTGTTINAQSSEEVQKERAGYEQPYHPEEDGDMRINQLLKQAKKEGKKVFTSVKKMLIVCVTHLILK